MRLHPEKPACPRRGDATAIKAVLRCRQPERGGKGCWDAEQPDRDLPSRSRTRIASEALFPREARVRALRTGEDHLRDGRRSGAGQQAHLDALVSHELDTGAPMLSPAPIPPEERRIPNHERMQEHTHLARLFGGAALPLTLLTQRTGATTANARRIHDTQTPIGLSAALLGRKRWPCWTPERPVGLERKVGSGEAPRFPRRVAVVGGPYPEAGADEAGRAAVGSLCGGRAGANSVMRRGVCSS
jgi:hypothetical protein